MASAESQRSKALRTFPRFVIAALVPPFIAGKSNQNKIQGSTGRLYCNHICAQVLAKLRGFGQCWSMTDSISMLKAKRFAQTSTTWAPLAATSKVRLQSALYRSWDSWKKFSTFSFHSGNSDRISLNREDSMAVELLKGSLRKLWSLKNCWSTKALLRGAKASRIAARIWSSKSFQLPMVKSHRSEMFFSKEGHTLCTSSMSPACRATRKQKPESRLPERLVVVAVVVVVSTNKSYPKQLNIQI